MRSLCVRLAQNATRVVLASKESSMSVAAIVIEADDCVGAAIRVACENILGVTDDAENSVGVSSCVSRDNILCVTGITGST